METPSPPTPVCPAPHPFNPCVPCTPPLQPPCALRPTPPTPVCPAPHPFNSVSPYYAHPCALTRHPFYATHALPCGATPTPLCRP
ncbi:hypothetical protein M8J77_026018 [Diaphorina citri]|nr:hypothetical protein M8J77_026018 [Diaphorina citri]